jgi:hypothetical protein
MCSFPCYLSDFDTEFFILYILYEHTISGVAGQHELHNEILGTSEKQTLNMINLR